MPTPDATEEASPCRVEGVIHRVWSSSERASSGPAPRRSCSSRGGGATGGVAAAHGVRCRAAAVCSLDSRVRGNDGKRRRYCVDRTEVPCSKAGAGPLTVAGFRGNKFCTAGALRHQRHSRESGNEVCTAGALRHQRHTRKCGNEVHTAGALRHQRHSCECGNEVCTAGALRHQRHSRECGNEVCTAGALRHQRHSRESGNEVRTAGALRHQRHSRESGNPVKKQFIKFDSHYTGTPRRCRGPTRGHSLSEHGCRDRPVAAPRESLARVRTRPHRNGRGTDDRKNLRRHDHRPDAEHRRDAVSSRSVLRAFRVEPRGAVDRWVGRAPRRAGSRPQNIASPVANPIYRRITAPSGSYGLFAMTRAPRSTPTTWAWSSSPACACSTSTSAIARLLPTWWP